MKKVDEALSASCIGIRVLSQACNVHEHVYYWSIPQSLYAKKLNFPIGADGYTQPRTTPTLPFTQARCHTVKVFHSKDMKFWTILLHYKYFSESMEKLMNH
jgi:hypothetical protein